MPHLSPPCVTPSLHRDVVPWLMGSMASECRPKRPWAEAGLPTSLSRQLLPAQVTSDREGEEDPSICTNAGKVSLTPCFEVQQALAILGHGGGGIPIGSSGSRTPQEG
jgi:hypothetical protein